MDQKTDLTKMWRIINRIKVCTVFCYCLLWLDAISLGVLNYGVCCIADVMDVVISICIVRRGTVGAHVWEV